MCAALELPALSPPETAAATPKIFDPYNPGRVHGNLVFLTNAERCFYIGLYQWQQKIWLRDHADRWKTCEDALRELQARVRIEPETELAGARSATPINEVGTSSVTDGPLLAPDEDDKLTTDATPPTIRNPEATAIADDDITIDGRRFIGERRVAEMLGVSMRTLQRWRAEGKGPPSRKIGRKTFYEVSKLQEWIDRENRR